MVPTTTYQSRKQWWESDGGFFGRAYMEGDDSYEGYLSTNMSLDERTQAEVDGVIDLLQLQPGLHILDCPCGYGRHSLRLAQRQMRVTGVDINEEELQTARQAVGTLSNIRFINQDMRFLNFSDEFDGIINMFYSFGFFSTDEENIQTLRNFYNALKPGGKFLMHTDVNIPRILSGKYKFMEQRRLRSGKVLEVVDSFDPDQKRINGKWTLVHEDGSNQELTPYSVRVFSWAEFAEWCSGVGFKKITGYGDWQGSPLTEDSEDMIVIAEK